MLAQVRNCCAQTPCHTREGAPTPPLVIRAVEAPAMSDIHAGTSLASSCSVDGHADECRCLRWPRGGATAAGDGYGWAVADCPEVGQAHHGCDGVARGFAGQERPDWKFISPVWCFEDRQSKTDARRTRCRTLSQPLRRTYSEALNLDSRVAALEAAVRSALAAVASGGASATPTDGGAAPAKKATPPRLFPTHGRPWQSSQRVYAPQGR